MKHIFLIIIFCAVSLSKFIYSQDSSKLNITHENKSSLLSTINNNGNIFISIKEFSEALELQYKRRINNNEFTIQYGSSAELTFTSGNPFVIILTLTDTSRTAYQLTHPPIVQHDVMFVPLTETIELLNSLMEKIVIQVSPTNLQVVNREQSIVSEPETELEKKTITLKIRDEDEKAVITILSSSKAPVFSNFFNGRNLHLVLWDVILTKDSVVESKVSTFINRVEVYPQEEYTEIVFNLTIDEVMAYYEKGDSDNEFSLHISRREYGRWYVRDTENFRCIYRDSHSHLVNHILASAENSLAVISELFNYTPSEKIVINTYDVSDYGFGGTTTIPLNFIRLEIEPLEPGYEVTPYNERFQWLISHELVHIAVNDAASGPEKFFRSIFGKVNPEKNRPITVPFSLLTGINRYTPRWHQEAPAVYLETWLSGGFGRVLGNFDEMYFRSLVVDGKKFPSDIFLDGYIGHNSFLLETLYYMYGGRFITHLAIKYGNKKALKWFSTERSDFLIGYKSRFKNTFGVSFSEAWKDFVQEEIDFQKKNIDILNSARLTPLRNLSDEKFGFVTEPYFSKNLNSIIYGYHRPGELANLRIFSLDSFKSKKLVTLPTPSAIRVASTAYDDSLNLLFYTTNNNQLYRDIHIYDLENQTGKILFENCRTGHLTISSKKHELFGIQHNSGNAILVRSKYPFYVLETLVVFEIGDEIQQLAINNEGDYLAAVIHRPSGQQSIVISDISKLDAGGKFQFSTITSSGSPENPYWSDDDKYLFWNAYTNGVSNIYRCDLETGDITALTHNLTGLYKPVYLSQDSLFAFKFSSDGMIPVIIPNSSADRLPAINYLGQTVLNTNPEVMNWALKNPAEVLIEKDLTEEKKYNSFSNIQIQTFIPVISGFQKSKVLGFFAQLADPILRNEISIEAGVSPFKELSNKVRYHAKFKYDFKQTLYIAAEHNPPDFFDLFNSRKRGTLGNRFAIGHKDYWLYDNPLKIKQTTELSYYTDTKFINDNLVEVSEPDFFVFRTEFEYKNLRRTIGSFDFEQGNHFKFSVLTFGADADQFEVAPGAYFEWDNYSLYLFDHNVFNFKLAAGYHYLNENILQAQYFFGGFGNREVENEPIRQYEKVFRFPGVPIYSIPTDNFLKLMVSNIFPPLRFNSPELFGHYIKNINFSVFSQGLITSFPTANKWVNTGAQLNIMFSHWYNLESTISAGVAKAWWKGGNDWEWFVSYKILRD